MEKYSEMAVGDTTSFEGYIKFMERDPYESQDGNRDLTRNHLYLDISSEASPRFPNQIIELPKTTFDSLKKYLKYKKERMDTISYKLKILVQKNKFDTWDLLNIIKIDSAKRASPIQKFYKS